MRLAKAVLRVVDDGVGEGGLRGDGADQEVLHDWRTELEFALQVKEMEQPLSSMVWEFPDVQIPLSNVFEVRARMALAVISTMFSRVAVPVEGAKFMNTGSVGESCGCRCRIRDR